MMKDNFHKSIIENSPIGYVYHKIIYNEEGIPEDYEFVEVNNAFERIIGLESEYLIGRKTSEIYPKIKRERSNWINLYINVDDNYKEKELEHHFHFLDKHYRVNSYCPKEDCLIIYFTDITREIEEKEKLNMLSDNISTQVWYLIDPKTYGSVNKAHADFLGVEKKDLELKSMYNFLRLEEAAICIEGNKKVFKEKKQILAKEWVVNSNDERRLLKTLKSPKLNIQGEVELVICSAEDITKQYLIEEQKNIRDRILYSMIEFTQELLTNKNSDKALSNGIGMLGNATMVDRVYYWENHYHHGIQKMVTSQRFEWCLDGITEEIDNPELQDIPFEEVGDFIGVLSSGKSFIAHIKDLKHEDGDTKQILEDQGILSILVLPVFVGNQFRGFIGFDSCIVEKDWSEVEVSLLNSFVLLYTKSVEKRILEEHVVQGKENFDNFFNMVQDLLFVLDLEGEIVYINDTALKRLNYSREEIISKPVWKLHPKSKREEVKRKIKDFKDKKNNYYSIPAITKDGYVFEVETRITDGIWDGKKVIYAVSKDISLLRRSEEKFSKAFNNSGVSMFISTFEEGEFIEANDTFLNKIGFKRNEIIGRKSLDLNIFQNFENREFIKEEIKSNKKLSSLETKIICKDNTIKTGLCNVVSLEINYQKCLLVSFVDMTDQNIMIKELAKAKEESDIANNAKSKFLSNMSHEIRTPMNAVIGYSDLLAHTRLNIKQQDYLKGVKASSRMLMSIINDILDWSKIDNDGVELEDIIFDIDEVIYNAVEQIKFKSSNSEVEILLERQEDLPSLLYGDPLRLQQVLLNLLSNSIKFTEVGQVKVAVKLLENKMDKVTLQFEISDTGIGISSDQIKDIFSPFKQVNNEKSNKYGGTGLGLSICKSMVGLMGGDIWVESELGEGSTFFFTSDFYIKDLNDNIDERRYNDLGGGKKLGLVNLLSDKKVLLVDDNEINQDVLKEILEEVGIKATIASSGLEAIECVKREDYDLVLMDIRMPEMDGYEATAQIRKIKSSKELPVIAVTASASPDEKEKCISADIDDCVIKPIERTKLFKAMLNSIDQNPSRVNEIDVVNKYKQDMPIAIKDKEDLNLSFEIEGIDLKETLDHLNGNKKLLIKILKKFKKNHFNVIDEIKEALSDGEIELAIRLAHTIKGVSGELVAKEIHSISGEIELKLLKGDLDIGKQLLELEDKLERLFASSLFQEKEEEKIESIELKEVDLQAIKPLLNKLEVLLSEGDIDSTEYIEKIEELTKETSMRNKVIQMKDYGEQYDFENALEIVKDIKSKLRLGDE